MFEDDPTAEAELEFEAGDEVRVIALDKVGTIIQVDTSRSLPYKVGFEDDNVPHWYDASEVEAAEEVEQASPFQVVGIIFVQVEG